MKQTKLEYFDGLVRRVQGRIARRARDITDLNNFVIDCKLRIPTYEEGSDDRMECVHSYRTAKAMRKQESLSQKDDKDILKMLRLELRIEQDYEDMMKEFGRMK